MEQEGIYYEMFVFTELMYLKNLILIVSKLVLWGILSSLRKLVSWQKCTGI